MGCPFGVEHGVGQVEVYVAAEVAAVCDLYQGLLGEDAVLRTAAEQLGLLANPTLRLAGR